MSETISRQNILTALTRLDELLRERGVSGELCIFGGAAMVLAFDARESTRDVDAIFVPKMEVLEAAKQVGEELGMIDDWLNDGVKGFLSSEGRVTSAGMPVFGNLRVLRPTSEYLLAMKCFASRVADYGTVGDRGDALRLIEELDLKTSDEVCDLIVTFYKESRLPAKVRFFVEELISEMEP